MKQPIMRKKLVKWGDGYGIHVPKPLIDTGILSANAEHSFLILPDISKDQEIEIRIVDRKEKKVLNTQTINHESHGVEGYSSQPFVLNNFSCAGWLNAPFCDQCNYVM